VTDVSISNRAGVGFPGHNFQIALLLCILAAALALFSWERIAADVVALSVLLALVFTGLLPKDASARSWCQGGRHSVWWNRANRKTSAVPRHREINEYPARGIAGR
jgi:hypothetical protein